ncbi:MAG: DUF4835 family protein [Crocinitomicaceae bacterium]|nr:DUF4835 family protein [Crocinitomicaceae bacterium]
MKQLIAFIVAITFITSSVIGQELNCEVSIVSSNKVEVSSLDQEVLKQLEDVIRQFMNETKWTKDNFKVEERINCQLQFQVEKIPQPGVYEGKMQVQSSRPIYNSNYNSILLNFTDLNVSFAFQRNAMLYYSSAQYKDNLTSMLAFYAYYIIGIDYDSFGLKDGTPYLQEAQNIVVNAQSSGAPGWSPDQTGNKNNRYWIIDNTLHQLFEPLRDCIYEYHRLGMDKLYENKEQGRAAIYEALNKLPKVTAARPNTINITSFILAKRPELKQVYSDASVPEKGKLVALLKRLDPTNGDKYDEILK